MEEKKIQRRHNSLWSLFGFLRINNAFFWRQTGFTFVELLVVIAVIGILVTASLMILDPFAQFQKANDAKRKGDLTQIQRALETHYHDLGKYPASDSSYRIVWNGSAVNWGSSWSPYMSVLPKDPSTPRRSYIYSSGSNGQSYWLYAALERTGDPQVCPNGGICPNLPSGTTCGAGVTCNFGVSSSNTSP